MAFEIIKLTYYLLHWHICLCFRTWKLLTCTPVLQGTNACFVTGLELAYIYAPRSMQGIIMALYWFSQGVGCLFGSATIQWFENVWFTAYNFGNINCRTYEEAQQKCHLDYYFYFISGVQVVGIVLFVLVTWGLDIGRPVPLRVQRQGHTLVRPTDSPARSGANNGSVDLPRIPRVRPRAINTSQSPEGWESNSGITRVGVTRGGNWQCHPYFFPAKPDDLFFSHYRLSVNSVVSPLFSP